VGLDSPLALGEKIRTKKELNCLLVRLERGRHASNFLLGSPAEQRDKTNRDAGRLHDFRSGKIHHELSIEHDRSASSSRMSVASEGGSGRQASRARLS